MVEKFMSIFFFFVYNCSHIYNIALTTSLDGDNYCLLFDVQNIKMPTFLRETQHFYRGHLGSTVSILKIYEQSQQDSWKKYTSTQPLHDNF